MTCSSFPWCRRLLCDSWVLIGACDWVFRAIRVFRHVLNDLDRLSNSDIGIATIPAFVITVLFFCDHTVSSQLAQVREFNFKKPHTYHWTSSCSGSCAWFAGCAGCRRRPNGAAPQALLHTDDCGEMVKDKSSPDGSRSG